MTHYDVSITSRLAKIFNHLPYFAAIFWITIFSATTNTNFVQIDHHLSKLWKKEKGVLFYETQCMNKFQWKFCAGLSMTQGKSSYILVFSHIIPSELCIVLCTGIKTTQLLVCWISIIMSVIININILHSAVSYKRWRDFFLHVSVSLSKRFLQKLCNNFMKIFDGWHVVIAIPGIDFLIPGYEINIHSWYLGLINLYSQYPSFKIRLTDWSLLSII